MRNIGDVYLSWPFGIRVGIWVFLLIIVLWRLLGRWICMLLSVVPWALKPLFRGIYLVLEIPVAALHKKYGSICSKIDSHLVRIGEKVYIALDNWYKSWKSYKGLRLGRSLFVCGICFALVVCPHYFHWNNNILRLGNTIFNYCEAFFVNALQRFDKEDPQETDAELKPPIIGDTDESNESNVTLVAFGLETSLLVRDVPDVKDYEVLARLYNGDLVTWSGQMTFSEADNERVEPWVKIMTADGIEGWSRLRYLHPEPCDDRIFFLNELFIQ